MKTLSLMSSNCGTIRTAMLADDGEIIFSDGSKSTEHIDKGFSAESVFVAMWMHKDALLRYKPAAAHSSMFNNTIRALGHDRPTAVTAHMFNELMGKKSVVMLDGTEYYFVNIGGRKVARPSGNKYPKRYAYLDVNKYSFIEYIQYTSRRRVAYFIDGTHWEIVCDDKEFYELCSCYWSDAYQGTRSKWIQTNYFNRDALRHAKASTIPKEIYKEQLNIFNYDASPIFCDEVPEPYTFRRGVLYGVLAIAFMLFLSSGYFFNQCFGAY